MKKAILYVSPEMLHDALNIPDGIEIVAIDYRWGSDDMAFLLSGESLPDTKSGEDLPIAHITVYRKNNPFVYKSELSIGNKVVSERNR
ncbi:MAG: hypothetical protein VW907_06430 [Opitutae bacterium]